uniref:Uncharacterized protein n=1 Tax=Cannabis sativa TaxID=3483 RepID=A0A803NH91_CANSA
MGLYSDFLPPSQALSVLGLGLVGGLIGRVCCCLSERSFRLSLVGLVAPLRVRRCDLVRWCPPLLPFGIWILVRWFVGNWDLVWCSVRSGMIGFDCGSPNLVWWLSNGLVVCLFQFCWMDRGRYVQLAAIGMGCWGIRATAIGSLHIRKEMVLWLHHAESSLAGLTQHFVCVFTGVTRTMKDVVGATPHGLRSFAGVTY